MEGKEWKAIHWEGPRERYTLENDRVLFVSSLVSGPDDVEFKYIEEIAEKLNDSDFEVNRVYEWLMDENREPANTKFTSGPTRNLTMEIESRINQLEKERDELREMLERLLNLKEYKDKNGKDGNYLKSQPIVREDAKSLLNKLK